jgi:hypothetical protein
MKRESIRLILIEELRMRKTVPRWFPGISQSDNGMRGSLMTRVGYSNLIQRPNIKVWNGMQRDHQGQRKHANPKSKEKCMVVCFFGSMGIVHKEWVPDGQSVS